MSDSTIDWSLIGKRQVSPGAGARLGAAGTVASRINGKKGRPGKDPTGNGGDKAIIKLPKGRYSRKKKQGNKKTRRGRGTKCGFLSEEDFSIKEGEDAPQPGGDTSEDPGAMVLRKKLGAAHGCWDWSVELTEEEEEDVNEKRTDATTSQEGRRSKRGSRAIRDAGRRRSQTVTVVGGVILKENGGTQRRGLGSSLQIWPGSNEVIPPWMADPNRNIVGYRSQEPMVSSARTSGVFWTTSRIRDNRRFPGTAEKTLHGQGLESVSAAGTNTREAEDHLLWTGARPPEDNRDP